jgi:cytochrome b involved in lipid metabolism
VIENNVIDLKEWEMFHPGGKFAIRKLIGGDATRYFYGAFQLVNDYKERRHTHSHTAIAIVNSMILG